MKKIAFTLLLVAGCSASKAVVVNHNDVDGPAPVIVSDDGGSLPTNDSGVDNNSPDSPSSDIDASIPSGGETDNGCGGTHAPKCGEGRNCLVDSDCVGFCSYDHACVNGPSCKVHFGGDTCGAGEVGAAGVKHETCCKTIEVKGFSDGAYAGKSVYLDKYEITAGRIRAFIAAVGPNVKGWMQANKPVVWNDSWSAFLPTSNDGDLVTINRLLLGDPRHDGQTPEQAGPGVILPPATDQVVSLGVNHQFGGQVYADMHGNNCGTFNGSFGFPTYWYPAATMAKNGEVPRSSAQELLDVKSMNCITNAMLAAFCAWDGGQLATAQVLDYVVSSPVRDETVSGCGTQYDNHGDLLGNILGTTVQSGGKCPDVLLINATFDAGDNLPVPGSSLNKHIYMYPDVGPGTSDKVWQIAAPGRIAADNVDGWMDLAGNLSEAVLDTSTGRFSLKHRGIGYGSARSDLNATLMPGETILRLQRPEVKSALSGGRCMRFSK